MFGRYQVPAEIEKIGHIGMDSEEPLTCCRTSEVFEITIGPLPPSH